MTHTELFELALDAINDLEGEINGYLAGDFPIAEKAKVFLHQAIAEAEQEQGEPVAIYQYQMSDGSWVDQEKHSYDYNKLHAPNATVRVVYTHPQPRREPLTDEQIGMAFRKVFPVDGVLFTNAATEFARVIEAAHGIKE